MTVHQETGKEMGTLVVKPDPTTTVHSCPSLLEYTWGLLLVAKKFRLSKLDSTNTLDFSRKTVAWNKSLFYPHNNWCLDLDFVCAKITLTSIQASPISWK